jgi:hypothetical protein
VLRPDASDHDLTSATKFSSDFPEIRYTNSLQKKLLSKVNFRENWLGDRQTLLHRSMDFSHTFHASRPTYLKFDIEGVHVI